MMIGKKELAMLPGLLGIAAAAWIAATGTALAVGDEGMKSPNPMSGDKAAIAAGQTTFRANCAYCHGMHADGRGRGLPNAADLRKFKRGYTRFVRTVKEGYKTMPPWGGMGELTDDQINEVGAYLETLAKRGAKWVDPEEKSENEPPAGGAVIPASVTSAEAAEPKEYQAHLGHIQTSWKGTPGEVGLVTVLGDELDVAIAHAGYAASDLENPDNIKLHTHHVRHALDPALEPDGGPGEGYGVVRAVEGVIQHMELARDAADASESCKIHSEHVISAANNILAWAKSVIDKTGQITGGASPVSQAFFAEENVKVLDWMKNGHDADGDGTISWTEGEGGLAQLLQHLSFIE